MIAGMENLDEILKALDRQIGMAGGNPIGLVVIGGAALNALKLVVRTTKDVDVLGKVDVLRGKVIITKMEDFPDFLKKAAAKVSRDFNLPENWLNLGPASQLDLGLPEGFESRLIQKNYGRYLTIFFASRIDLIHFKLFASIDRGGYHVQDLLSLHPSKQEIKRAAHWVLTQDTSQTFRLLLKDFLKKHSYEEIADQL